MTRTRARRLARTAFGCWGFVALTAAFVLLISGHTWPGLIALAVVSVSVTGILVVGPDEPARPRPQSPPRRPDTFADWRVELEIDRFRAEISAWEASQRSEQ